MSHLSITSKPSPTINAVTSLAVGTLYRWASFVQKAMRCNFKSVGVPSFAIMSFCHFEHFDIGIDIVHHGQQLIQRCWIKRWHNSMAILMFVLRIMNVQLCKLWMLSFDRTHGFDFVIKFTLNAKGVRSSASCYRLINFGTKRSECQH